MEDDNMLVLLVGKNAFECLGCGDILGLHSSSRLKECPSGTKACKRKICVSCVIRALDNMRLDPLRWVCCQTPAFIEDFARVLGAVNFLQFRMRYETRHEVPVHGLQEEDDEPMDDGNQAAPVLLLPQENVDIVCDGIICQHQNSNQTKVKCPDCPRLYHAVCLLEEVQYSHNAGDEFRCLCYCRRSFETWRMYIENPRNWINADDN